MAKKRSDVGKVYDELGVVRQGKVKELQQSLVRFGWKGLDAEAASGLTMKEVKQVLKGIDGREVREVWREAARERPKLEVIGSLMDAECKA